MTFQAYTHVQSSPSTAWTITHPFDSTPVGDVTTTLNGSTVTMIPLSIKNLNATQILVEFSVPITGKMRLVGNVLNATTGVSGIGSIDPGQIIF